MKDTFIDDFNLESSIVNGTILLTIDLGTENVWKSILVTQLNDVFFGYIDKGVRCVMKTELVLTYKSAQPTQIFFLKSPKAPIYFEIKSIDLSY